MERKMKYSGAEWIGDIPVHWETTKIGAIYSELSEKVSEEDFPALSVTMNGVVPQLDYVAKSEDQQNRKLIRKNNFVINSRSDRRGAYGVAPRDGSCSVINIVLEPKDPTEGYFNLVFQSTLFPDEFYRWGTGIVADLWSTRWESMRRIIMPCPPEEERVAIAKYLNRIVADIDAVISDTRDTIQKYKELKQNIIIRTIAFGLTSDCKQKESGMVWAPYIPEGWKVMRGKSILRCLNRDVREDDDVVTCFRDGQVTLRSNRREEGFTMSIQEAGYQGIEPGDLVVHGMDGFAGAIGISDSRGKGTPVLNVLDSTEDKRFIMYYLRSLAYKGVFLALSTGIRVRSCDTNWNKLKTMLYPVPPRSEQNAIANYLDSKSKDIEEIIESKVQLVHELSAYKRAIVYEYVTGKKEVPV